MNWKMVIMLTVVIIYATGKNKYPIRVMKTWNGCPYRFDMGFRGAVYPIPKICSHILSELTTENFTAGETPFSIRVFYTLQRDKFRVKLDSEKNISMSEMVITARPVHPNGTIDHLHSVGYFHQKVYHEYYCCDRSKLKAVVRRFYTRRSGYFKFIHLNWSPLNYTGRVVFRADVFVGPKGMRRMRYPDIQSKSYLFPPVTPSFQIPEKEGLIEHWTVIEKDEYDYDEGIVDPEEMAFQNETSI